MYENHQIDVEMYKAMQAYTTIGLEKIHSTNKRYMKEYEHKLDEKARIDMRVGRKPKNYHSVVGKVQKYKNEYAFVKRTQPKVEIAGAGEKNIKRKTTNRNEYLSC